MTGWLANLTTLNPSCNMIMDVPSELSQLTNPREVSLSHNQLTIFPLPLASVPQLDLLDFSTNSTSTLPGGVEELQASEPNLNQ